jgi:Ca2+-binding RTX toxin-like protein
MGVFTELQLGQLKNLVDSKKYPEAYNFAAQVAEVNHSASYASITWLYQSSMTNAGIGPLSAFIRSYSAQQYTIRYDKTISPSSIQDASDKIAEKVLSDILKNNEIPTIETIALKDAQGAAETLFDGDAGGWGGNPLFLFLGLDTPLNNNVLEKTGDTYDTLAMLKLAGSTGTWQQLWNNLSVGFATATNIDYGFTFANGVLSVSKFLNSAYGGIFNPTTNFVLGTVNGDDLMQGTANSDTMNGGGGNDVLNGSNGSDIMDGGQGIDTADFSMVSGNLIVTVKNVDSSANFAAQVYGAGLDSLFGIEKILGTGQDDTFIAQNMPTAGGLQLIDGGGGKDILSGVYLNGMNIDVFQKVLTSGNNTLSIGHFEEFEGSLYGDKFTFDGSEISVNGKEGRDIVDYNKIGIALDFTEQLKNTRIIDCEVVIGSKSSDTITLTKTFEEAYGKDGDDTLNANGTTSKGSLLVGGSGGDHINGGDKDDRLVGGNDFNSDTGKLFGRSGESIAAAYDNAGDYLAGGKGNDSYYVNLQVEITPWPTNTGPGHNHVTIWDIKGGPYQPPAPWSTLASAGIDHISDSDQKGKIFVDMFELPSLTFKYMAETNVYQALTGIAYNETSNPLRSVVYAITWGTGYLFYNSIGEVMFIVDNIKSPTLPSAMSTTPALSANATSGDASSFLGFRFLDKMNQVTLAATIHNFAGTASDDYVIATVGDDNLNGGLGNDVIDGLAGKDIITGGDGYDDLRGGLGADTLYGGADRDQLSGGADNDALYGGDDSDVLHGDGEDDSLTGGAGDDKIYGDTGTDTAIFSGGFSNYTVTYDQLNSSFTIVSLVDGTDIVTSVESFQFSDITITTAQLLGSIGISGDDGINVFIGDANPNTYYGLGGNDSLKGLASADKLYGGDNDDQLNGGTGGDLLDGGNGFDTARYDDATASVIASLVASDANTGEAQGDSYVSIEGLVGSSYGDTLTGNAVDNVLYGLNGADTLFGLGGADTLYGGDGIDVFYGGMGADAMYGGTGNDLYEVDNIGDTVIEVAGAGNGIADNVYAYVDFTLGVGVDNLIMLYGNQRSGTGNSADNIIYGNSQLNVLQGGGGYDTLIGGAGSDYYIVNAGFGVDVINDFTAGAGTQDAIVFSKSLFTTFAGVLSHAAQVGADTWIGDGFGNTVVLSNVLKTSLHADDFQFA